MQPAAGRALQALVARSRAAAAAPVFAHSAVACPDAVSVPSGSGRSSSGEAAGDVGQAQAFSVAAGCPAARSGGSPSPSPLHWGLRSGAQALLGSSSSLPQYHWQQQQHPHLQQRRHKTTTNLDAAAKAAGATKSFLADEVVSKLKDPTLVNTAGYINGEWVAAGDLSRFEVGAACRPRLRMGWCGCPADPVVRCTANTIVCPCWVGPCAPDGVCVCGCVLAVPPRCIVRACVLLRRMHAGEEPCDRQGHRDHAAHARR